MKHLYKDLLSVNVESHDVAAINNAIRNILLTPIGSLEGMPEFGSRLHEIVFAQMDHITEDLARRLIGEAIYKWEPRIAIINVDVKAIPEFNRIVASMEYRFKDDVLNSTHNFSIDLLQ